MLNYSITDRILIDQIVKLDKDKEIKYDAIGLNKDKDVDSKDKKMLSLYTFGKKDKNSVQSFSKVSDTYKYNSQSKTDRYNKETEFSFKKSNDNFDIITAIENSSKKLEKKQEHKKLIVHSQPLGCQDSIVENVKLSGTQFESSFFNSKDIDQLIIRTTNSVKKKNMKIQEEPDDVDEFLNEL